MTAIGHCPVNMPEHTLDAGPGAVRGLQGRTRAEWGSEAALQDREARLSVNSVTQHCTVCSGPCELVPLSPCLGFFLTNRDYGILLYESSEQAQALPMTECTVGIV